MLLKLTRRKTNEDGTFGELKLINQNDEIVYKCYTLEPKLGNYKQNEAIPCGVYKVKITYSQRFKKMLPEILVKGRSGIRIHSGNTKDDTTGCILVGETIIGNTILKSRKALGWVMYYLQIEEEENKENTIIITEQIDDEWIV